MRRDPGYGECEGHESTNGPIGNTVYCDGRCTARRRCPFCDQYDCDSTCEDEPERCSSCGELGCAGTCEQGADDGCTCYAEPEDGVCQQCRPSAPAEDDDTGEQCDDCERSYGSAFRGCRCTRGASVADTLPGADTAASRAFWTMRGRR